jgi:hypothetical protein
MLGGGAEEQQRHPAALGVHGGVVHLLAHGLETAQIVMLLEQALKAAALLGGGDQNEADLIEQDLLGRGGRAGRRFLLRHAAEGKKSAGPCPAKSARALFYKPPVHLMNLRWRRAFRACFIAPGGTMP